MFCNKCGNELRADDLFCAKCGNQVAYNTEKEPVTEVEVIDETDKLSESVELLKHGDESGFADIYSHTYKYVYLRAKYMLGNEDDAQDLIQDVYMALYKGIDKLESNNCLYGWLKTVIFRQGIKFIEKKRKNILVSEEAEELFEQLPDENVKIEEGYGNEEDVAFIKDCIELLSEEQRLVVLAYYYDNMKVSEIADIMGVSEGTVKSRLYLARKRLQSMLEVQEEKQGYKFYGAGMPMLVFALGDIMESDIAVDGSALQNGYAELCKKLGIEIAAAAEPSIAMAEKLGAAAETVAGIAKKKIAIAVAGVLVAGGISGAIIAGLGDDKEPEKEAKQVQTEENTEASEEVFDETKFMAEIRSNVECLKACYMAEGGFCTEVAQGESLYPIFADEEAARSTDETAIIAMVTYDEWNSYPTELTDPLGQSFNRVLNFSSKDEVRKHIAQYIFDDIFVERFQYTFELEFIEYGGILYYGIGSIGYYGDYDLDSIYYAGERNGKHYVGIDFIPLMEDGIAEEMEFTEIDGHWVITDIVQL